MPEQEDIYHQLELLKIYRSNLKVFLKRKANLGGSTYCPPEIPSGIEESRGEIARIKNILRGWGVSVEDHPDDLPHDGSGGLVPKPRGKGLEWLAVLLVLAVVGVGLWFTRDKDVPSKDPVASVQPTPSPTIPTPTPNARVLIYEGKYTEAIAALEPRARNGDNEAALMLGEMVETSAVPREIRFQAADVFAAVGDPRPGVSTLPPAMVEITGGTFVIGKKSHEAGDSDENNELPVKVGSFAIGRYEITNAQYKLFMDDGGYDAEKLWWDNAGRAWLQEANVQGPRCWGDENIGIAHLNHPVVCISWYEAVAFCRWLTQHSGYNPEGYVYRLPTEAEWEYAARRDTRRIYPWGNEEPDGERANYNDEHKRTTAVGVYPKGATPDGIYDIAGNVWEWTGSIFKAYPYDPNDGREDLSNPASSRFVLRGGGWNTRSDYLRASDRHNYKSDYLRYLIGFRLARTLP